MNVRFSMIAGAVVLFGAGTAEAQTFPCSSAKAKAVGTEQLKVLNRKTMGQSLDLQSEFSKVGERAGGALKSGYFSIANTVAREFKPLGAFGTSPQVLLTALAGKAEHTKDHPLVLADGTTSYVRFALKVVRLAKAGTGGAFFNLCRFSQGGISPSDFSPRDFSSSEVMAFSLDPDTKAADRITVDAASGNQTFWKWLPADAGVYDEYALMIEPRSSVRTGSFEIKLERMACEVKPGGQPTCKPTSY